MLLYLNRWRGLKGNDERAAENATALEQKLQVYERILSKQKYLAGDVSFPRRRKSCIMRLTFFNYLGTHPRRFVAFALRLDPH